MRISSIFPSIDGEVNSYGQGHFTTFIRLQGCNFFQKPNHPCSYCDTVYAQDPDDGIEMSIFEILDEVKKIGNKKCTITGGEPLLQKKELIILLTKLFENNRFATVETNGSIFPEFVGDTTSYIMDYKLPSSGVSNKMLDVKYFRWLRPYDVIKFVVANRDDFDYAVDMIDKISTVGHFTSLPLLAFSPVHKELSPQTLIDWIEKESLNKRYRVSLNVQLHKLLNLSSRTERGEV